MNSVSTASTFNIGVQGLKQSVSKMSEHAQNMQTAQIESHNRMTNQDTVSISESTAIHDSKQYDSSEQLLYSSMSGLEAKANAKVIQTSIDTMGIILDLKA